jgi:hypothetical protein
VAALPPKFVGEAGQPADRVEVVAGDDAVGVGGGVALAGGVISEGSRLEPLLIESHVENFARPRVDQVVPAIERRHFCGHADVDGFPFWFGHILSKFTGAPSIGPDFLVNDFHHHGLVAAGRSQEMARDAIMAAAIAGPYLLIASSSGLGLYFCPLASFQCSAVDGLITCDATGLRATGGYPDDIQCQP